MKWEFNIMEGKNPQHTASFLNSYSENDFTPEEIAARESAQNTIDAGKHINTRKTELVFHEIILNGESKEEFFKIVGLKDHLLPRLDSFKKTKNNFRENAERAFNEDELKLLLVRDYGTCGLGGDWQEYERLDHFSRLVLALGLDDKAEDDSTSGGSFGLGKTAYAKSSLINTVFYHSVFEPSERSNNVFRRFMGTGIYPSHEYEGVKYGGYVYIGDELNEDESQPFKDHEANDIWESINNLFPADISRSNDEIGTDILIPMTSLDLDLIKEAIENYYFPALIENRMIVRFIDKNGSMSMPDVNARENLDQFVSLYIEAKNYRDREDFIDNDKDLLISPLKRHKNHSLGKLSIQRAEIDEAKSVRSNCVAITRGTGMIVNYLKVGSEQYQSAVGVFIADEDVHEYLIKSENPAHSAWEENSSRLKRTYGDLGQELVKRVDSGIKNKFINFQKDLQPDVSYVRGERGLFSKLLSTALKGSKAPNIDPVPPSTPNPVALSLIKQSRNDEYSIWRLKVKSNDNTPNYPFQLSLKPSIVLMGDSKKVRVKHMNFDITGETEILNEDKPSIDLTYHKGDILEYFVKFLNPGRLDYMVECNCQAELEG